MKKLISPTIRSSNEYKTFFNFKIRDIIFFLVCFLSSLILWVPFLFFGITNLVIGLSIFFIIMSIIFILIIQVEDDVRLYQWIHLSVLFFLRKKKIFLDKKINKIENNTIFLENNKKITIFRIIGEDTSFVDDYDFENFATSIEYFLKNKNYFFFKMDGDIDLENYKKEANEKLKIVKNLNIRKELENNLKIINEFNNSLDTSTQTKYFIGLIGSNNEKNDLHNINAALIKSNIKLEIPKMKEFDEILKKAFFIKNEVTEYKNYIKTIDEKGNVVFNRFIELKKAPYEVYREWLSLFFNQQGISIYLKVSCYSKEEKLDKKINDILAITEHKLNTINFYNKFRQEELEKIVLTFNDLVAKLSKDDQLKKVSMIIKIEGKTKEEAYSNYKSIIENINNHKFKFDRMTFKQITSLKNFIPDGEGVLSNNNYVDILGSVLSFGSPFNSLELLHPNSSILAKDKNNTPISINFKLRNQLISSSSMTILGKTGSGKTTTTKRIIKNNIIDGGFRIFCVDPENEYGDLIESFGGVKIDNTNPKYLINPFEMKKTKDNTIEDDIKNKISTITNFLEMLFNDVLKNSEIKMIIHVINKMYYKNKYNEFTFSDIYKELEKDKEIKKLPQILIQFRDYCKCAGGTNSSYWDDKSRLNIDNDYICFQYRNLINLPKNLGFALIYNSFEYINNVVMNNMNSGKYISIFIDEAHLLLNDKHIDVVKRVVELYKRIRKYNGMITIITQNITDLYKSNIKDYTSVIMNNSQYLLLHTIKPTEISELEDLLKEDGGLSIEEKDFLKTGISGDCLLMFGKKRTQIKVIQ